VGRWRNRFCAGRDVRDPDIPRKCTSLSFWRDFHFSGLLLDPPAFREAALRKKQPRQTTENSKVAGNGVAILLGILFYVYVGRK